MDAGNHAAPKDPESRKNSIKYFILAIVLVGIALSYWFFAARSYGVPSASMETTIMTGDRVFAEKISFQFREVQPQDIVTFEDPEIPGRVLVKRCIAVGGQTVDLVKGVVHVDGVALDEPYIDGKQTAPLTSTIVPIKYPYKVPDGHIWVMGDNRTNSKDSRHYGPVDTNSVHERAYMVYWPLERIRVLQ